MSSLPVIILFYSKALPENPSKIIKKRRTRFPSPPPITRYQSPFLAYLSRQNSPESSAALQSTSNAAPSPTVPEYCPPNCFPVPNEPLVWNQPEPFNYCNSLPAINNSYSLSVDTSYYKQDYPTHLGQQYQFETQIEPEFPSCQMATQHNWYNGGCGLFEDIQLHPCDGFQWLKLKDWLGIVITEWRRR